MVDVVKSEGQCLISLWWRQGAFGTGLNQQGTLTLPKNTIPTDVRYVSVTGTLSAGIVLAWDDAMTATTAVAPIVMMAASPRIVLRRDMIGFDIPKEKKGWRIETPVVVRKTMAFPPMTIDMFEWIAPGTDPLRQRVDKRNAMHQMLHGGMLRPNTRKGVEPVPASEKMIDLADLIEAAEFINAAVDTGAVVLRIDEDGRVRPLLRGGPR